MRWKLVRLETAWSSLTHKVDRWKKLIVQFLEEEVDATQGQRWNWVSSRGISFLLSFSPDDGVSVEGEDESDAGGGVASGGHRKPYSNDNEPALNELREPLLDDL